MGPGGGSLEEMVRNARLLAIPFVVAGAGLTVMAAGYSAPFIASAATAAAARTAVLRQLGKRAWHGLGFLKRPIHTSMAWRAGSSTTHASSLFVRSLGWRKKGNMVLLGISAINPLENVNYLRQRDWTRLFINYHLPFIGVPIYNLSTGGDGPGGLPNFHRPPPSIEETGEILSKPHIVVEIPDSPRPSTSKKAGKRRMSCPPGYRWDGRRCVKKG